MKAQQSHQAQGKAKPLLSRDPVFLRLFEAALIGVCGRFKRNPGRSLTVEEGLICQETELAWKFARRARELIDIEEARAEICERFNRGLMQAEPEGDGDQLP